IVALDDRVDEVMAPFAVLRDLLDTITGIGRRAATGDRRPRFGDPGTGRFTMHPPDPLARPHRRRAG
ncbi:MAG: hypothetical protein ACRDYX_12535, partial [Egibacteraceae bacterium]